MKHIKIKLTKNKMAIQSITVANDDGTTQVFTAEQAPAAPQVIAVPLNTPIEIVAA